MIGKVDTGFPDRSCSDNNRSPSSQPRSIAFDAIKGICGGHASEENRQESFEESRQEEREENAQNLRTRWRQVFREQVFREEARKGQNQDQGESQDERQAWCEEGGEGGQDHLGQDDLGQDDLGEDACQEGGGKEGFRRSFGQAIEDDEND